MTGNKAMDFTQYFATFLIIIFCASSSYAVTYECPVSQKLDNNIGYFSKEKLEKYKFSIRVTDDSSHATLSRCGFDSGSSKVTCDNYEVDKIVSSLNRDIKKYYVFSSHFDVQIFSDMQFVENNGRMTIAFGTCHILNP